MKKWTLPKISKLGKLQKVTAGGSGSGVEGSCSAGNTKTIKPGC